jgi:hypothetical protein
MKGQRFAQEYTTLPPKYTSVAIYSYRTFPISFNSKIISNF